MLLHYLNSWCARGEPYQELISSKTKWDFSKRNYLQWNLEFWKPQFVGTPDNWKQKSSFLK